jgi:hypothetical protein
MPWSIGANVSTGDVLTASRYNQDVIANLTYLSSLASAWTAFTPQLRTATTNRASTVTSARYLRVGSLLIVNATVVASVVGGASEPINLGLPTGFTYTRAASDTNVVGTFQMLDVGTAYYQGAAVHFANGYVYGSAWNSGANMGQGSPAMTMAANDVISYSVTLEVSP